MRLATIVTAGATVAPRVEDDTVIELDAIDLGALLQRTDWRAAATAADGRRHQLDQIRFAPVIPAPRKIICVGLNYLDHIRETGLEAPVHPTLFTKFAATLCGAHDDLVLPSCSDMIDWEVELAFVIGKRGRHVSEDRAMAHIAGFTVVNDVSVRDWQRRTSQWDQGKNFEATTPLGPVLVTPEACDGAADLRISCTVDGVVVQDSRTSQLLFSPAALLSYISTFTTLEPGDVISTGTPSGIGASMTLPTFLRAGQVVEATVEGIGSCRNLCLSSEATSIVTTNR